MPANLPSVQNGLHWTLTQSRLVLMAIFPRGETRNHPLRAPIQKTNQLLAQRFGADPSLTYIDLGAQFLAPDGSLPPTLMPDGTHPSDAGYQLWADALIKAGVRE